MRLTLLVHVNRLPEKKAFVSSPQINRDSNLRIYKFELSLLRVHKFYFGEKINEISQIHLRILNHLSRMGDENLILRNSGELREIIQNTQINSRYSQNQSKTFNHETYPIYILPPFAFIWSIWLRNCENCENCA